MHISATKHLPENYTHYKTLDLRDHQSMIILNLIAIGLLFPFIFLFEYIVNSLRPEIDSDTLLPMKLFSLNILSIIFVISSAILIHELIHGLFFWIFTKETPKFAFKFLYAYAAAPEWYIPKNNFVIIGLSPVIMISSCVILLLIFISPNLVTYLTIAGIFNLVGSTGDLIVITWILIQPTGCLIKDSGESFSVYINNGLNNS